MPEHSPFRTLSKMQDPELVSICTALSTTLFLFFLALGAALFPLFAASSNPYLKFGNVFAGGFLLSAALLSLLPEGNAKFRDQFSTSYPLGGLFALLGAGGMFIVDFYLHGQLGTSPAPLDGPPPETDAASYILAIALSLHSLVEGLALGAAMRNHALFVGFYIAVVAHKFFEAVSLGASLAAGGRQEGGKTAAVVVVAVYAALTPLGMLVGRGIIVNAKGGLFFEAALTCVSAGIFLYVALAEMLVVEIKQGAWDQNGGEKALVFCGSVVLMGCLSAWVRK